MTKSVAYVLNYFPLPSETFIADEMLSLYEKGFEPFVICLNEGNLSKIHPSAKILIGKMKIFRLADDSKLRKISALIKLFFRYPTNIGMLIWKIRNNPQRWMYIQALRAAEWCLKNKIDYLHAHFAGDNFIYASIISELTRIPFGVTTHRYDIFNDPIEKSISKRLFNSANVIITISEFNRKYMVDKYDLPFSRIKIVHCGIDLERFKFYGKKTRDLHKPLKLLNVGRLVSEKAQDVLLKSIDILKKQGVVVALEIIGDGPERENLARIVSEIDIADSVVFHGIQTEEFVRERLVAADIFVLSSRSEGLPVVCMEALAVGTPVIATRIFGIPELIDDKVSGLLVPPEDPEALADAIYSVSVDPTLLQTAPSKGRSKIESSFERGACTSQLTQIWDDAISNRMT